MFALPRRMRRNKAVSDSPQPAATPRYTLPQGSDDLMGLMWARSEDGELAMSTVCAPLVSRKARTKPA